MYPEYRNLYQRGKKGYLFFAGRGSRANGLSAESMKQYESGRRVPSDDTVAPHGRALQPPLARAGACKATDRLGVLPDVHIQPLPTASITLANRFRRASDRSTRCLRLPRMASSTNASALSLTPLSPICARPSPRPIKSSTLTAQKKTPRRWHVEAFMFSEVRV